MGTSSAPPSCSSLWRFIPSIFFALLFAAAPEAGHSQAMGQPLLSGIIIRPVMLSSGSTSIAVTSEPPAVIGAPDDTVASPNVASPDQTVKGGSQPASSTDIAIPVKEQSKLATGNVLQTVSRAFLYSTSGFDVGTTVYGIQTGRREANPLLGQHRARITLQIVGTTVAADFAASRLARAGHPGWAAFSRFFIGTLHLGASIQNLRRP